MLRQPPPPAAGSGCALPAGPPPSDRSGAVPCRLPESHGCKLHYADRIRVLITNTRLGLPKFGLQALNKPRGNILIGIIRLTVTAESALHFGHRDAGRQPSASRASASRSATRNGHRPAATATNTSGPAASVQPTGSECCLPPASRKNTRSSAQVWRTATNTNSRPDHGWNGWVTRTIRCAAAGSGVVDDAR